jgi:hypothetical protein
MNFERGAWTEATEEAEQLLRQPGLSVAARIPALTVVGRVRTRCGAEGALEPLEEAWALAMATGEPQRIVSVAAALTECSWLRSDLPSASEEGRSALEFALRDRNHWRVGELAFWAHRAGATVDGALAIARPFQLQLSGNYLEAAQVWAELGCPYEQAFALADSPDVELRKQALEIFNALGAQPMSQRLRRQLRRRAGSQARRQPLDARQCSRTHGSGARSAGPRDPESLERGHRTAAVPLCQDRRPSRERHSREARYRLAARGG